MVDSSSSRHILNRVNLLGMIGLSMMSGMNQNSQADHGGVNPARTVDLAERKTMILSEYRTRLIADVVTGNLDVYEAAATLPDEPYEAELLDDTEPLSNSIDDAEDGTEDDHDPEE